MKKIFSLALIALAGWGIANAVPAKPGLRTVTQADGSTIKVRLAGDEWHHSLLTEDNLTIEQAADGNYYYRTNAGVSKVQAHDAGSRSASEMSYVMANMTDLTLASQFTAAKKARKAKAEAARKASQVPQTGSPKIPVILVNYSDVKFKSSLGDPLTVWRNQISAANKVSVFQYFKDQSFGQYTPQFDVYGPVNLANNRATYGGNDSSGNDKGVGQMVAEACTGANGDIDFSQYDNDGDGVCDVVIVLYAGVGEASSSVSNSVWPCQWDLYSSDYGSNLTLDGTTVSKFAVFNELNGSDTSQADGIGTMCHEFSHCIDLPDWYDVNYAGHFGMGNWSLLDGGCYNNDGYTPCAYTAYEREFMGWYSIDTPQPGTTYTLDPITATDQSKAYKVVNDANSNEYYILENIQQTGWNEYAPNTGLLVTHVYYNASAWSNNSVNTTNTRRMTIIPADNSLKMNYSQGYYFADDDDQINDLYPYGALDSLTNASVPAAATYVGNYMNKPIKNITKNGTQVSFSFMPASVPPLATPVATDATNVSMNGFTANWNAVEDATKYTLKVNKKGNSTLILTEDFAGCTSVGTTDIGSSLDNYLTTSGWTGSKLYMANGGVRLGSSNYTGSLASPELDMTASGGKMTVEFDVEAYGNDTSVGLNVSVGSNAQTVTVADANSETYKLVFDCTADDAQQVIFMTSATRKRAIITGIRIYAGDATASKASANDEIVVNNITTTSYNVTGLEPSTEYTYTVKAANDEAQSAWSNIINVTTLEDSLALPVPVLQTTDITATSISLLWNSCAGATSYTLVWASGEDMDQVDNLTDTTYTFSNLTPQTLYEFYVIANYAESTTESQVISATTLALAVPVALAATDVTYSSFTANWEACEGATSYNLYWGDVDGENVNEVNNISETCYEVTGLQPEQEYAYWVEAVYPAGTSAGSEMINVTTAPLPIVVPVLNDPTADDITTSSFRASWEAVDNAESYTLRVNKYTAPEPSSYTLVLQETFDSLQAATNDIGDILDDYLSNPGWTGSKLYPENGGLRLASRNAAGSLVSPALDMTESKGKLSVEVTAHTYGNDTNVPLIITVGEVSDTLTFASSAEDETFTVVLDCEESNDVNVSFATSGSRKRVILTDLKIYSGEKTENPEAPVESRDGDEILVTDITANEYVVAQLEAGATYKYEVKAIFPFGESEFSASKLVTLLEQTGIFGDVNGDGEVTVGDVSAIYNIILGLSEEYKDRADVNGDGEITVGDVSAIYGIIVGAE